MGQGEATPQYQIVITPRAARNLRRLDRRMMERVARRIDALVRQPYLGKPLKGRLKDKRSLRVGAFRVIYRLDTVRHQVVVENIGHRREIY